LTQRYEATVEIAASAGEIFPWLVRSEQRCRWMEKLVESEQLTEGPPEVGVRFRDVFEDHGRRIELEAEVTAFHPDELLQVRLRSKAFEATTTQRLEEANGLTRLRTEIETRYTIPGARFLSGLVTRHAQRQLEADLAGLKQLVEESGGAA
jgi:uncharacterized protein YndB with AHSA1/START domain